MPYRESKDAKEVMNTYQDNSMMVASTEFPSELITSRQNKLMQ